MANNPSFREWWAAYLRMGASPGAAEALTAMNTATDIRDVLPLVRVPTLVIHRSGDRCLKVEEGRYIAARIPNAKLIEVPGEDHLPFVGDQESILEAMESFLLQLPGGGSAGSVLATVLAAEFEAASGMEAAARAVLERFDARETAWTWPRITAAFHGPMRALQCATELQMTARDGGSRVRIGLHTGEFHSRPSIGGTAVLVSGHVLERAGWEQTLATGTLRDLVAGSAIRFVPLGRLEAGAIGEWQLLEVR